MQWFQIKEKSAGKKRLIITYYVYKLFGHYALYCIAFFVALFTFLFSKDLRFYSKKYLMVISKFIKIKPSLINQFKQIYSYAISLADKIVMYLGEFNTDNIIFDYEQEKKQLFEDISKKQGICFIFSHIGNIEVLQAFFHKQKVFPNLGVNVFLNKEQTKIFNDFIDTVKKPIPAKYIIAEDFDICSIIQLKENLNNGEILFIAGDRLSKSNSSKKVTKSMFLHSVNLPYGTFQLAKLLEVPVYFISAIRQKDGKYKIILEKNKSDNIIENYIKYMEEIILKNPFQFYHFYDFFN